MVIGRFSGVFLHSGAQKIVMENHHLLFVVENTSSNGPFFIAMLFNRSAISCFESPKKKVKFILELSPV